MGRNLKFAEGEYYHLYNRGVEGRKLFLDEGDYRRFTSLLYTANGIIPVHLSNLSKSASPFKSAKGEAIVDIGAWCLMPNHFHILVREKTTNGISLFMKKLLTGYSMFFNIKRERKGVLFENTFYAKHLDTDNYLKYQYAYIHLNPIGIIDSGWKEKKINDKNKTKKFLSSYPYSSYLDYTKPEGREELVILNKEEFPEYFQTFNEFNSMINEWIDFEELQ